MGNNSKKWVFSIVALTALSLISCKNEKPEITKDIAPEGITQRKAPEEDKDSPAAINGAIIFVDKSASLQKVDPEEALKAGDQIFDKLKAFLGDSGGEVTIYFIHKDLAGASPFFKKNCTMPDIKDKTALPKQQAINKYKIKIDSLKNTIMNAINTPISQPTGLETDLWITLKKAEDGFANLPQNGKRLLIYYSDMVESVSKPGCGKDYGRIKFKSVPDAIAMGKKDASPIKTCYSISKFSGPSEVFLCFPVGALQTSNHPYMFDYWKALFGEFGAGSVNSNL